MRRILGLVIALAMLPAAAHAGSAWTVDDPVGDANGSNAAGQNIDSRPASLGAGDLVHARIRTTYVAVPVGEDGIDYQETGLRIEYTTEEVPAADVTHLAFALYGDVGGCSSTFRAILAPPGRASSPPAWVQFGPACPDVTDPSTGTYRSFQAWPIEVSAPAKGLSLTIPFSSLPAPHAQLLRPGAALVSPRVETRLGVSQPTQLGGGDSFPILVDRAGPGTDFVIGSDVPPDVPCTRGCPTPIA